MDCPAVVTQSSKSSKKGKWSDKRLCNSLFLSLPPRALMSDHLHQKAKKCFAKCFFQSLASSPCKALLSEPQFSWSLQCILMSPTAKPRLYLWIWLIMIVRSSSSNWWWKKARDILGERGERHGWIVERWKSKRYAFSFQCVCHNGLPFPIHPCQNTMSCGY